MAELFNYAPYFRTKPPSLEIGKVLSRGSYGEVLSGRLDGKEVAVKRIYRLTNMTRDNFQRECRLLEGVDHPNVVKFKGAFYDDVTNEPVLVMERMTETLRDYLNRNRGKLIRLRQLQICISIASGLRYLHSRTPAIVHRDLTDKNVLLDANEVVKISDLGQARLKNKDYFHTSQPGAIPFMSPEALKDPAHYNEKLDVFSLGVLMLEVATQQSPKVTMLYIGHEKELHRRREDFSKLDDDHPLCPLIQSCLKDEPKERPDIVRVFNQLLAVENRAKVI